MMKIRGIYLPGAAALLAATLAIAGCATHPDEKAAIYSNLNKNNLRSVTVSEDQQSGQITLRGIVGSDHDKAQALTLAQQAAPGYTIYNKIQVETSNLQPSAPQLAAKSPQDLAIEHNYQATIDKHKNLKSQHIEYSASNGTLTLKGTVKTQSESEEAAKLAKQVPDVQNVVNQIAVQSTKPSSENGA
ncbi:MAG TPA: BON domain-containing protein [Terracidiphilus sp.]|nr:BON domain-containing protein [Terracidiphilus sp.]